MRMMPVDAHDIAGAERVIEIGYPEIGPVMRDMVNTMRVGESPVADAFAAYFGQLGEGAVDAIGQGLMRENCSLRHRVFTMVLPHWPPEAVRRLTVVLGMVMSQPDAWDNDLLCMEILARNRMIDLKGIGEWLSFKKRRWALRGELLRKVEETLRNVQHPPAN